MMYTGMSQTLKQSTHNGQMWLNGAIASCADEANLREVEWAALGKICLKFTNNKAHQLVGQCETRRHLSHD